MPDTCCHPPLPGGGGWARFIRNKLLLVSSATLVLIAASALLPVLKPFRDNFFMYARLLWWPLGAGFILAGLIDRFVPPAYISKFLARPAKRTVFYAAGLGLLMSACSHGILAISMELHKKGASGPAVISFLLASPWTNLPVTILLVSLFHGKGIIIIVSALVVAITTGLIFLLLDQAGLIEKNKDTAVTGDEFSVRADLRRRWAGYRFTGSRLQGDVVAVARGMMRLANMILWWIVIGVVLASAIGAYVPADIFHNWVGPDLKGLFVTLLAATVIEICSEGSAPLAFELYRQTRALGNSFVFLSAGVVTDYTEIGLVGTNLGWRTAAWMVAASVPQVLFLGWVFNLFL